MGAMVGGLFAAGLSAAELREIACGLNLNKYIDRSVGLRRLKGPKGFFEYLMLTDHRNRLFKKVGLDKGDVVEKFTQKLTGDVRIESLPSWLTADSCVRKESVRARQASPGAPGVDVSPYPFLPRPDKAHASRGRRSPRQRAYRSG